MSEIIRPYRGTCNPSPAEREATEAHRLQCYADHLAKLASEQKTSFDFELPSMFAWEEWAAKNRAELGLSHLNELADAQTIGYTGELAQEPKHHVAEYLNIKIGTQDVVIKHGVAGVSRPNHGGGGKRGKVTKLSAQSIDRMKLHIRNLPDRAIVAFLTLTYPADFPTDGTEIKRHLKNMREWLKRRKVGGVWFLEFQARGAPHFHLFLSAYPAGGVAAVSSAWHKIVGTHDEKHLRWHKGELSGRPCLEMMRKPHAASAYAVKYASKLEQKLVPDWFQNVGRFWGHWGKMRPVWEFVAATHHAIEATRGIIMTHRCQFADSEDLQRWSKKAFLSTTMLGCAQNIDKLFRLYDWIPF